MNGNTSLTGHSIGGESLNHYVKIVDSEYNDETGGSGSINGTNGGQTYSQNWTNWYYEQMFNIFDNDPVWGSVQFALSGGNSGASLGDLNLINPVTYGENDAYSSFQDQT